MKKMQLAHVAEDHFVSVENTHSLIKEHILKTPVRRLHWLEELIGYPVYAKLESQQITGSFKYRGALSKILKQDTNQKFIAASAGNHGLAVACAASKLGEKANICVPVSASPLKKEKIINAGAGLIEHGSTVEEATEYAIKLANDNGWAYISPYNDIDIILGQGTVWKELLEECPNIEHIISPIGGGGLISGASFVVKNHSKKINILGCEPENYLSMKESLENGKITNVLRRPTFADGLATNLEENSLTFQIAQTNIDHIESINEEDIATSVIALLNKESLLAEGAGAISIMACVRMAQKGLINGPVGITICGGNIHHTALSRLQAFPIENKTCLKILNRRGIKANESPIYKVYGDDHTYYGEEKGSLKDDMKAFLNNTIRKIENNSKALSDYEIYCSEEELVQSKEANTLVKNILNASKSLVEHTKDITLNKKETSLEDLIKSEVNLRAASQAVTASQNCLNWRSPVYSQSMVPQFFFLGAQDSGDVNYERYGFNELRRVERQLLNVFNLPADKYACTVVNSGMAAYSLVEGYLLRHVLKPDDKVSMSPYIYFESDEQLKGLDWLDIRQSSSYDTDKFIKQLNELNPKAVFVDSLANTTEQRIMDVPKILNEYMNNESTPNFVIDGSMMPCALSDSLKKFKNSKSIFYIESCSKYLQFGLDMSMAGVVIHDVTLKPHMDRIRRNMGSALTENGALLFPEYDQKRFMDRVKRVERNASNLAQAMNENQGITNFMRIIHPSLLTHQDNNIASKMKRYGGCITFKLKTNAEDHKDQLEAFIDMILNEAIKNKTPITKGVSFGFSFNRLCSASSMAENDPPFLRFSVGDHPYDLNKELVKCFEYASIKMSDLIQQNKNSE